MSAGGREVEGANRPLVACERHTDEEIERAVNKVYGDEQDEEE
jgi:hypothetical protein